MVVSLFRIQATETSLEYKHIFYNVNVPVVEPHEAVLYLSG